MPISKMCKMMGVSKSGYYKWLSYKPTDQHLENEKLARIIKKLFMESNCTLGYREMTRKINKEYSSNYNEKRIRRLMRKQHLITFVRRASAYCTKTSYVNIEENILNRDFTATKPDEKWVTDVTHLRYGNNKKAYLSAIKDLYDGSIVAYKVSTRNDTQLVIDTLHEAKARNMKAEPILHSDRGSQYTSKEYQLLTTKYFFTRSMSRSGNCLDNASIESFFGTFKVEAYHLQSYPDFNSLCNLVDDYIYHYNNRRYQRRLNNCAPLEYRNLMAA